MLELLEYHKNKKENKKTTACFSWTEAVSKLYKEIKKRGYTKSTLKTYTHWVYHFNNFISKENCLDLNTDDVQQFLEHLAVIKKVKSPTQRQAFNSLLFFFRHVIGKELGDLSKTIRAKKSNYIPTVLSQDEVFSIIKNLNYPYNLMAKLMYGCGLRLFEAASLRVHSLNFYTRQITIYGKGEKFRSVPLPETVIEDLEEHVERLKKLHQKDLNINYNGTFIDESLERKYKNCAKEFPWQWVFPAKNLVFVPDKKEIRRYHLHKTNFQKLIKKAIRKTQITKRVSSHTLRHSFASHLLLAGYDITTVQKLLGHSNVKTTMIYLQTVNLFQPKKLKSPLDIRLDIK